MRKSLGVTAFDCSVMSCAAGGGIEHMTRHRCLTLLIFVLTVGGLLGTLNLD
jgi:hypothetical protein